jgi:hypothetical protein
MRENESNDLVEFIFNDFVATFSNGRKGSEGGMTVGPVGGREEGREMGKEEREEGWTS